MASISSKMRRSEAESCPSDNSNENPFSFKTWMADQVLIVEDKKLFVNKAVLGLVSPVFAAMFQSGFEEQNKEEIVLPGKKVAAFIEFLCCLYPNILKQISRRNVAIILPLADEYQVDRLKTDCCNVLLDELNILTPTEDLFYMLSLACSYNLGTVEERCIKLASERDQSQLNRGKKCQTIPMEVKCKIMERKIKILEREKSAELIRRLQFFKHCHDVPEGVIELTIDNIHEFHHGVRESNTVVLREAEWKLSANWHDDEHMVFHLHCLSCIDNDDNTYKVSAVLKGYYSYALNEENELSRMAQQFGIEMAWHSFPTKILLASEQIVEGSPMLINKRKLVFRAYIMVNKDIGNKIMLTAA